MADNNTILITGAASGIGAALARRLAQPGNRLTLHTRGAEARLKNVAKHVEAAGAEAHIVLGDLAETGAAEKIIAAHEARFGALDHLVANAGFPLFQSVDTMTAEDIEYAFRGNVESLFALTRHARPMLAKAAAPRIVTVGSFTASLFRTDMTQFPASAASKGAVEVATRSLALGLSKDGINVNCVVPGYIKKDPDTDADMTEEQLREVAAKIPMGRLGQPDEVAAVIAFLLGKDANYVTGQIIHVNGGLI